MKTVTAVACTQCEKLIEVSKPHMVLSGSLMYHNVDRWNKCNNKQKRTLFVITPEDPAAFCASNCLNAFIEKLAEGED